MPNTTTAPHRMTRPLVIGALLALPLTVGLSSQANAKAAEAPPSPRPWLEAKVEQAKELATRKVEPGAKAEEKAQAEVRALINEMLDWDELTRRSLGSQWKKLDAKQQKEFSSLLREMIETSYESKLRVASRNRDKASKKKVSITWQDEELRKSKGKVTAKVKSGKTTAFLEFSLLYKNAQWKVYDLAIDDVRTVSTYRSQFRKLISQRGFDALLEQMRTKIKDIRAGRGDLASAID